MNHKVESAKAACIARTGSAPSAKDFRKHLNAMFPHDPNDLHMHDCGRSHYRQRTRQYGDYLYFQDRERFDWEYIEYLDSRKNDMTEGAKP